MPETTPNTGAKSQPLGRRNFLIGAGLTGLSLAGVGALSSCAPSTSSSTKGGKTKVRIASWMQFEPGRKEAWKKMVKKFNAQSKDIEVSMVGWPFTEYANQVLTQVGSGALEADLITAPPDLAARLLSLNVLDPVDKAVSMAKVTPDKNMHAYMTKGGKLYGVSVVTVAFGVLYNQAIYDKAGFQPATNIDEWVQQAAAMTHRPDSFGLIAANTMAEQANFWFQLQDWANAYGGVWAKGKKPMVTSEPIIKTLELYKQMFDQAIPKGTNDAQQMELMGSGRAAQGMLVSATVNVVKAKHPEVYPSLRSFAAPWPSKKQTSRVHPISIYKDTENKEAATEFLAWLFKPENMAELMIGCLDVIPPYPQIDDDPAFKKYAEGLPWVSGYRDIDVVTPMQQMGDFINANDEFGNTLLSSYQKALSSKMSVADAMAEAQPKLEQLADRL